MNRSAHSPMWWLFIGWWWAPAYWCIRVATWVVALPLGIFWSWVHARSKDRGRTRRGRAADRRHQARADAHLADRIAAAHRAAEADAAVAAERAYAQRRREADAAARASLGARAGQRQGSF